MYQVEVTQSSGERQVYPLEKAQTTLGSDAGCDIQLSGEPKLLPHHLMLAPQDEHCWISAAKGAPVWDQHGQPVQAAFVPWGARLSLGACTFHLQHKAYATKKAENSGNRNTQASDKSDESRTPSPILLMFLLCISVFAALEYFGGANTQSTKAPQEYAALFDAPSTCEHPTPLHRAQQAEDEAYAKSERAVFVKQDGIEAVSLFREAEACYRKGKRLAAATANMSEAQRLQRELEEEYQLLRLRLSRALQEADSNLAAEQLTQLLELLRHRSHTPYVLALRRLNLRLSKEQLP